MWLVTLHYNGRLQGKRSISATCPDGGEPFKLADALERSALLDNGTLYIRGYLITRIDDPLEEDSAPSPEALECPPDDARPDRHPDSGEPVSAAGGASGGSGGPVCPVGRREQDELICDRCRMRWGVSEARPECPRSGEMQLL